MSGIQSIASYLPGFEMQRSVITAQLAWFDPNLKAQAKGVRRVANWDEDAITMAVAAARRAVSASSDEINCLTFATTSAPFLDRSNSNLISEALSLLGTTLTTDSTGSQRAATSALLSALRAATPETSLLCAADRRAALPGSANELRYGDAAAAVVTGAQDGLARFLAGATIGSDFVDHYRTAERATDYNFEDRWIRDVGVKQLIPQAVKQALTAAGRDIEAIDHLVLPIPAHHAKTVIKSLGLPERALVDNLFATIGDSGVGHGLLMLDQCIRSAQAGQTICLVGFGQGCDALLFEACGNGDNIPGQSPEQQLPSAQSIDDYLKLPAFSRVLQLGTGIRAEADKRTSISAYYRHHQTINSMLGSVCDACATPHFPPSRVCVACAAIDQLSDYSFADRSARIKSFTEDWQTATPSPPMCYGNVEFEGGGNAFLELSDVAPDSLQVGSELRMQFRIKDYDDNRGFRRYFWKPVPLRGDVDTTE